MRFAFLHRNKLSLRSPLVIVFFLLGLNVVALLLFTNIQILSYSDQIVSHDVATSSAAFVFGGGMSSDTEQTLMQMDRVATAVQLYEGGQIADIYMTGDDGANRYDEVHAMKAQAEQYFVPADDVHVDPHGYRTYESCWRMANVYNVTDALVVSQTFHLPRIIYICEQMGVDVTGVSADLREYPIGWGNGPREMLARLKAWLQVEITKPLPKVTY